MPITTRGLSDIPTTEQATNTTMAANAMTTEDAAFGSVGGNSTEDESEIKEFDLHVPEMEESDLDKLGDFEKNYPNLFKTYDANKFTINEYAVEKTATAKEQEKFKNIVNYMEKCNSDQHFIVKMHTRSIYDLAPLPEEPSALHFGQFTDKLVLHLWVLQMLDQQDVDRWSGLLIHLISNKLDPVTRDLWNLFAWNYKISEHGQNVTMTTLLEFLRATCREYEIRKPSRSFGCITYVYNNISPRF